MISGPVWPIWLQLWAHFLYLNIFFLRSLPLSDVLIWGVSSYSMEWLNWIIQTLRIANQLHCTTMWVIDVDHQLNRLPSFCISCWFFISFFLLLFLLVGVATHFVSLFLSRFGIVFRTFHWSCRMVFYFLVAFDWPLMSRLRPDLFNIAYFPDQTHWFFHFYCRIIWNYYRFTYFTFIFEKKNVVNRTNSSVSPSIPIHSR